MRTEIARKLGLFCFLLIVVPAFSQSPAAKSGPDDASQVAGVWRGNSTCMVKDSPCHDEVNVYRISTIAGKPGLLLVIAGKIVDGKEIVMGSGEWKYDAQKHTLEWEISGGGVLKLTVDGNKMEGALTVRGTLYRRISLKKEK